MIWSARWLTLTWIRRMPSPTRPRMIQSMIGRPATVISGFGTWRVRSPSRVPLPPAITTAVLGRAGGPTTSERACTPRTRPAASTSGMAETRQAVIRSSTCARGVPATTVCGLVVAMSRAGAVSGRPAISARRMSPSVSTPCSRFSPSTRQQIDSAPRSMTASASRSVESTLASGSRSSRSPKRPGSRDAESSASVIGEDPAPSGCVRSGATAVQRHVIIQSGRTSSRFSDCQGRRCP